jgi:outer membrane receptor protein involved in Fe transport
MSIASQFATQSTKDRKRGLALLIAALCAGQASANETGAGSADSQNSVVLEEVLVTAQKREESLQSVPMAVSALTAQAIENAGINNMSDVSRQVPVLEVQSSVTPVFTNFRIRRVGNLGNIPTFEPAVGLFVDGAFRSRAIFGAADMFDLDRIEILRGPQSTLYGKNTTAGVVGIYTAAPSNKLKMRGEATVGNIEGGAGDVTSTQFKAGVSGPLSDTFRAGISGSYTDHGPTMGEALANSGSNSNDTHRYSARGQMSWDATDALNLRFIAGAIQENDKQQTSDIYIDPNGPLARQVLPLWRAADISDVCADNDPHNRITCVQQPLTTDLDARDATLLANYKFANGITLSSISSWDYFMFHGTMDDVAQMNAPLLKFRDVQESESLQQELRLTSADDQKVTWLAGAFYYENQFKRGDDGKNPIFLGDTYSSAPAVLAVNNLIFGAPIPIAAPGQVGYLASNLDTQYYAVYGQAKWHITDQVGISAGVRGQEETKDSNIRQWVNIPGASVLSLKLTPAAISATGLTRTSDAVTWQVTPDWKVTDDVMLFATASKGFKSGGYNTGFGALSIAQREFGDEDIMHYEAGAKFDLWNGRARLATSVFQTDFNNYQDAAFVGGQFTVGNAEKTRLKGAELEGTVAITERVTADAAVSYADLRYVTNTHGQCYPGRPYDDPVAKSCVLSGEHPVNAPEWKTHLGVQYDQPVSFGSLYARADWAWTSEYNTSFSADPRLKQAAYDWINLRAGTRFGHDDHYEVVAWVENVTNVTVANLDPVVTLYALPTDGSYQSLLQDPRSYGVTFKLNF